MAVSAVLTGFDAAELAATGMAETYREFVKRRVEPLVYSRLVDGLAGTTADVHTALGGDVRLGELARAVCHLWYLGEWPGLVNDDGGAVPCLVSGRAYARGLVWRSFGGHAPGTGQPGYGTWADVPAGAAGGGVR
ncbi:hypothetical protein [Streptomyces sp. NPDC059092]|uniref:hypothetical protein n=1 Tax=Streptomyces sp. NPDC059092 TaxID=3346725 RepID=UPI00367B9D58